jgi:hypothetical protein
MKILFLFSLISGKGIGSLITGKLFDPVSGLGEVWTFRFYGFFALFTHIVYAAVQYFFFREPSKSGQKPQNGNHISDQGLFKSKTNLVSEINKSF